MLEFRELERLFYDNWADRLAGIVLQKKIEVGHFYLNLFIVDEFTLFTTFPVDSLAHRGHTGQGTQGQTFRAHRVRP